jgi:hypothetical protein
VTVCDRSQARMEQLESKGASIASGLGDLAVARGWADLDWSALGLLAASDAGLGDTSPVAPSA